MLMLAAAADARTAQATTITPAPKKAKVMNAIYQENCVAGEEKIAAEEKVSN